MFTLHIIPNLIVNTIGRIYYVIVDFILFFGSLFNFLNLNSESKTRNNKLHDLQLLTRWDNSKIDSTAIIFYVELELPTIQLHTSIDIQCHAFGCVAHTIHKKAKWFASCIILHIWSGSITFESSPLCLVGNFIIMSCSNHYTEHII